MDCKSGEECRVSSAELKKKWDAKCPGFYESFRKNQLPVIINNYLPLSRHKEAGGIPGRVSTNDAERMNRIVQEALGKVGPAIHKAIPQLEAALWEGAFEI